MNIIFITIILLMFLLLFLIILLVFELIFDKNEIKTIKNDKNYKDFISPINYKDHLSMSIIQNNYSLYQKEKNKKYIDYLLNSFNYSELNYYSKLFEERYKLSNNKLDYEISLFLYKIIDSFYNN